jgi:hypothetical protein
VEAVDDALQMGLGTTECFVVTGIGDDDVGIGEGWDVGCLVDGLLELVDMLVVLGRNLD